MSQFAVCEINGKQYKIYPNTTFEVSWMGSDAKNFEASVLLLSTDDKVQVGSPYLKDKIKLEIIGEGKKNKIRASKFHAKANYRKTTGLRQKVTQVSWVVKN